MKYIIYFLLVVSVFQIACDKNEDFEYDLHKTTAIDFDSIKLTYAHNILLTDGVSELTFDISLHKYFEFENANGSVEKSSHVLPDSRIAETDRKFYYQYEGADPVAMVSNVFIADENTVEDKVFIYTEVLGVQSPKQEITLRKPVIPNELYAEKTIPVVFHVVNYQGTSTLDFKLEYEHILAKFTEINKVYRRLVNRSPNGFDTKINFVPAEYSPWGDKLKYPGMNVVTTSNEYIEDDYESMTGNPNLDFNDYIQRRWMNWDSNKYFNVWVVKSKRGIGEYGWNLNYSPKHVITGHNNLAGLNMQEVSPGDVLNANPLDAGAVISYNDFTRTNFTAVAGKWLGLFETINWWGDPAPADTDFCDDTFVYGYEYYQSPVKIDSHYNFTYQSTNIMDFTTTNTTVTLEQAKRMLHVLNYCPTRMCWKE